MSALTGVLSPLPSLADAAGVFELAASFAGSGLMLPGAAPDAEPVTEPVAEEDGGVAGVPAAVDPAGAAPVVSPADGVVEPFPFASGDAVVSLAAGFFAPEFSQGRP